MATPTSKLLYAASANNPDQLYFGRVSVPDPFIAFSIAGKKYAIVNALEYARVKRDSAFDVVLPLETYAEKAMERFGKFGRLSPAETIAVIAAEFGQKSFLVPEDFPASLYARLSILHGIKLEPVNGPIFPEREIKTPAEAAKIKEGNRCAAAGIAAAEKVLKESKISNGKLTWQRKPLTSERLRTAIEIACLEAGSLSIDTIAAGGNQACDPHHGGSGVLRANQLIVVDVFPRVQATGYHGDMTRTFLKGRANDFQKKLVATVREAQLAALKLVKAGVNGQVVHQAVNDTFSKHGYKTERTEKGATGFFHGTGHGLGLAVHEAPRVSTVDYVLKAGSVVTIEPGLYYPGHGGCRIEDVVQVTDAKPKMLSSFHYNWEIK
ncbi:Xaa-Pro aminopeptidase [Ereboglobus sp. PH5-10]|uniref:Peptidase M24 n=1 Tax=Ereboglobus luteus TaxID=1796921 RepID=A0A2U8E6J9_9BACT|nr:MULTISPECIES: M24 family metallopeptidase [Ereboglobus]AWI10503.1 peptidase M24 [Ereboglobus luteus]MDF9827683.1 Xaa-Pro aminopeptidase [Ereboglobus sp. PH5-10]